MIFGSWIRTYLWLIALGLATLIVCAAISR